ncbi:MAG: hypothetical protein ACKOK8_17015, partial [Planctomycetia bacterium]
PSGCRWAERQSPTQVGVPWSSARRSPFLDRRCRIARDKPQAVVARLPWLSSRRRRTPSAAGGLHLGPAA